MKGVLAAEAGDRRRVFVLLKQGIEKESFRRSRNRAVEAEDGRRVVHRKKPKSSGK